VPLHAHAALTYRAEACTRHCTYTPWQERRSPSLACTHNYPSAELERALPSRFRAFSGHQIRPHSFDCFLPGLISMDSSSLKTANLLAIHKHVATKCAGVNKAWLECKDKNQDPKHCLDVGKQVLSCTHELYAPTQSARLPPCAASHTIHIPAAEEPHCQRYVRMYATGVCAGLAARRAADLSGLHLCQWSNANVQVQRPRSTSPCNTGSVHQMSGLQHVRLEHSFLTQLCPVHCILVGALIPAEPSRLQTHTAKADQATGVYQPHAGRGVSL
jgi:hypothetical protein